VPTEHDGGLRVDAAEELLGGGTRASPFRCEELYKRAVAGRIVRGAGRQEEEEENA